MAETPQELYRQRERRLRDSIELRQPDRAPFAPFATYFPVTYAGLTFEEAMHDYDKLAGAVKKFILDFQPDAFADTFRILAWAPTLEILDYKQLVWPGHGGKPDATYQFVEGEYMSPEEYDAFIADPSDFLFRKFLPRVWGLAEPFSQLRPPAYAWYTRSAAYVLPFAKPEVAAALEGLVKAGQEAQRMAAKGAALTADIEALGFPRQFVGTAYAPFDYIGDFLRGTRGIMLDMFKRPEKLLAAIDKVTPMMIEQATSAQKTEGLNRVFIPLHKGLDGFMSREQFLTFYWPSLRKLIMACIDAGFIPNPLFEGDCTSRLELVGDLPRGKAVYWFERTSLFRAKEVLGDTVCIEGGPPASLLISGSPDEVRKHCKELIDVVGKGGGFIMNGATGIPDEAKPENVRAMADTVHSYR